MTATSSATPPDLPRHFGWLDALRGIAALCVVVYHYHHFYLADAGARPPPDPSVYPHAAILGPAFRHGDLAVELFWVISGFVFAHVYLARPAGARDFWAARIARLYPLHLATLLLVAVLQAASLAQVGHWQVFGNNDGEQFVLHLALASHWAQAGGMLSFNAPIWSVSFEMVAYALFLAALPALARWPLAGSAAMLAACWAIFAARPDLPLVRSPAFVAGGYFFAGVLVHVVLSRAGTGGARRAAIMAALVAGIAGAAALEWPTVQLVLACAAIVLGAALADALIPSASRPLRRLGDISYSLYLVHVPLQIAVLLVADMRFGGSRAFAAHPATLPVYLAASIALAMLVHVHFERPAGRWLRRALSRGPERENAPAVSGRGVP